MPAPSKTFTSILDTDVDPDSPITTGLMTALRDNDIHLEEWLGFSFVAAQDHNHDGVNSALVGAGGIGATISGAHTYEIFDHFTEGALNNEIWATQTNVALTVNGHLLTVGSGGNGTLISNFQFRLDQVAVILEGRIKMTPATTQFSQSAKGFGVSGSTRGAEFVDEATADEIRCQTRGSAGTQNTDNTAVDLDTWNIYKIDLTNPASIVFYLNGTAVATHATVVPDAQDLAVDVQSTTTPSMMVDRIRFYAATISDSTA